MRPIVIDGHAMTADDLTALRGEVIRLRDDSFKGWPETIEVTTILTYVVGVLTYVAEDAQEVASAPQQEDVPSGAVHSDPSAVGKVVPPRPLCEAEAHKGTGHGICLTQVDEHGVCPNAGKHCI